MLTCSLSAQGIPYYASHSHHAPYICRAQVLVDEKLAENADRLGTLFRAELNRIAAASGGIITIVRGRGLLNAMVVKVSAYFVYLLVLF